MNQIMTKPLPWSIQSLKLKAEGKSRCKGRANNSHNNNYSNSHNYPNSSHSDSNNHKDSCSHNNMFNTFKAMNSHSKVDNRTTMWMWINESLLTNPKIIVSFIHLQTIMSELSHPSLLSNRDSPTVHKNHYSPNNRSHKKWKGWDTKINNLSTLFRATLMKVYKLNLNWNHK